MTQLTHSLSRAEGIREALELDQIQPIIPAPSLQRELADGEDAYRTWYEEELERLYAE